MDRGRRGGVRSADATQPDGAGASVTQGRRGRAVDPGRSVNGGRVVEGRRLFRHADGGGGDLHGRSVARVWDEALLDAIRRDVPAPTVHARNLFHTSAAMWDAWAAYDPQADGYFVHEKLQADDVLAAREAAISLEGDPDHLRVLLDGRDVSDKIRQPDASHASSVVATIPEVREAVVEKLREMARAGGVVMDGRDIGTKVFPNAQVKLFLDASLDVRARRRCDEERERGREVTVEQIKSELEERDRRDRERAATPLVRASGAVFIDTSNLSLNLVIDRALEIARAQR